MFRVCFFCTQGPADGSSRAWFGGHGLLVPKVMREQVALVPLHSPGGWGEVPACPFSWSGHPVQRFPTIYCDFAMKKRQEKRTNVNVPPVSFVLCVPPKRQGHSGNLTRRCCFGQGVHYKLKEVGLPSDQVGRFSSMKRLPMVANILGAVLVHRHPHPDPTKAMRPRSIWMDLRTGGGFSDTSGVPAGHPAPHGWVRHELQGGKTHGLVCI